MRAYTSSFSAQALSLLTASLALWSTQAGPSLDVTNKDAVQTAAEASIKNLLAMYGNAEDGGFNQVDLPWWASATIWDMILDYTKWSNGDTLFNDYAVGGLANMSYNNVQDVLNGEGSDLSGLMGRWNDDIGWVALAIQNGVEVYGADKTMPGTGGGKWDVVPTKTAAEMYAEHDDKCGGGIYWSRNRYTDDKTYKSTISSSEFAGLAAKVYVDNNNETMLNQAQELWTYLTSSGMIKDDGSVLDGTDTTDCSSPTTDLWTYNFGQAINAAVWLSEGTGDSSYLDTASSILSKGQSTFGSSGNVVRELCEPQCARDSKNFKAVFLRSLPYLYRTTQNDNDKTIIEDLISSSVSAMTSNSCDDSWHCGGNWTKGNTFDRIDIADQHVSSALLVAAMGVYNTDTEGIRPSLGEVNQASAVSAKGSAGAGPTSTPVMESSPLNGAQALHLSLAGCVLSGLLAIGTSVLWL